MSDKEKRSGKLVEIRTERNKDAAYILDAAEHFLQRAKEGDVEQVAIIWNVRGKGISYSLSSSSKWSLVGMIQQALHEILANDP